MGQGDDSGQGEGLEGTVDEHRERAEEKRAEPEAAPNPSGGGLAVGQRAPAQAGESKDGGMLVVEVVGGAVPGTAGGSVGGGAEATGRKEVGRPVGVPPSVIYTSIANYQ